MLAKLVSLLPLEQVNDHFWRIFAPQCHSKRPNLRQFGQNHSYLSNLRTYHHNALPLATESAGLESLLRARPGSTIRFLRGGLSGQARSTACPYVPSAPASGKALCLDVFSSVLLSPSLDHPWDSAVNAGLPTARHFVCMLCTTRGVLSQCLCGETMCFI